MFETEIAKYYVKGTPWSEVPKKFIKRTRASKNGWGGYNHGLQPPDGTKCFSYNESAKILFSYAHYRLAERVGSYILVNGEAGPTMSTNRQRRALFDAIARLDVPHAVIPFSTLRGGGITTDWMTILDVTSDQEVLRTVQTKKGPVERRVHFLGECLFEHRGSYYLSGLDRNDDPNRWMYYLCRLPERHLTVEEALAALRPTDISERAVRQGEWFFDPADTLPSTTKANARGSIISERAAEQEGGFNAHREGRHRATSLFLGSHDAVYAKGNVYDTEHSTLKLGAVWHRVRKNRALEGWRYTPEAGGRTHVD